MAGARSVAADATAKANIDAEQAKVPQKRQKVFGRMGRTTQAEKEFVQNFVEDMPGPITERQIGALAKTMRRSKDVIRKMVEDAAETFAENANFYIQSHRQAVADALSSDTMAGKKIAADAAQWAIEHMSGGGARIIEKAPTGPTGTKIMIGVKIGGHNAEENARVEVAEVIDAEG